MSSTWYAWAAAGAPVIVAVEAAADRWRGVASARSFADRIDGASHVVGELVLVALLGLDVFAGYEALLPRVALLHPSAASPLTWLAAFLALDFVYWVGHRACHRVALLWALHAVHHQQRGYGLSVGLRGPWLGALQIAPFMVPLAVAGFPPSVLFPLYAGHTVYKLAVHADLRRRLGALEGLLVTPASHRAHHATEASRFDTNFGGVLAIWDRLFGTHRDVTDAEARSDAMVAGPALPAASPLAHNVAPWVALFRRARHARGLAAKAAVLFGAPVADVPEVPASPRHEPTLGARAWSVAQLGVAAVAATWLAAPDGGGSPLARVAMGAAIVLTLSIATRSARGDAQSSWSTRRTSISSVPPRIAA